MTAVGQRRRAEAAVVQVLHEALRRHAAEPAVAAGGRRALEAARRSGIAFLSPELQLRRPSAPAVPPSSAAASPGRGQAELCRALSDELDDPGMLLLASSSDDEISESSPQPAARADEAGVFGSASADVLALIFGSLSCADVCLQCAPVCRSWRDAARGAACFQSFDIDNAGTDERVLLGDANGRTDEDTLRSLCCWLRGRAKELYLSASGLTDKGLEALVRTDPPGNCPVW